MAWRARGQGWSAVLGGGPMQLPWAGSKGTVRERAGGDLTLFSNCLRSSAGAAPRGGDATATLTSRNNTFTIALLVGKETSAKFESLASNLLSLKQM